MEPFWQAWLKLKSMGFDVLRQLPIILLAVIVFFAFYYAAKGVRATVHRVTLRQRRGRNVGLVFGRLAQAGIVASGLLVSLVIAVPSIQAGDVIGFLGISSVAIGFAFRDILQNFLAGILLLLTEPFRIGDQIIVGGYEGTVEEIQTRATYIKTYDGRRVVIPNADLFTQSVTVNTAFPHRRLQYDVGIGYGDDVERARELILGVLRDTAGVLADPPPDAIVVDLADSTVNIRARWWVAPPRQKDVLDEQDRVLTSIKNALVAHGIDLPFPTTQVLFHDQTEETDGDRRRQREGWPAGRGQDVPRPRSIAAALRRLRSRERPADGHDGVPRGGGERVRHRSDDPGPHRPARADAPGEQPADPPARRVDGDVNKAPGR